MKFAIIENDKVANLIVAESMKAVKVFMPDAEIIEVSEADLPFAGVGQTYDRTAERIVPIQPFPSWVWNESDWKWDPPVPHPGDGRYTWDEDNVRFAPYTEPTN